MRRYLIEIALARETVSLIASTTSRQHARAKRIAHDSSAFSFSTKLSSDSECNVNLRESQLPDYRRLAGALRLPSA